MSRNMGEQFARDRKGLRDLAAPGASPPQPLHVIEEAGAQDRLDGDEALGAPDPIGVDAEPQLAHAT